MPGKNGTGARADGRALRGERNREQIVDAILALIRDGEAVPTAEMVARRAKVGTRTVFRHFADMEGLYAALNERLGEEVIPIFEAARFEGDTRERLRELVRTRNRVFERIAPLRRRESAHMARSVAVQEGRADLDARLRRQMHEALAPELEGLDADVVEVLDTLLSWESWNRMRTTQRLGGARVARLLEEAAASLIAAEKRTRR